MALPRTSPVTDAWSPGASAQDASRHKPGWPEADPAPRLKLLRRLTRLLACAFLGALSGVLLLVAASTLPVLFGYHTYIVYGGSMGEDLPRGSVAVAARAEASSLEVGDIIAVKRGDVAVLHRIVSIESEDGQRVATMQGDENAAPDPEPAVLSGEGDRVRLVVPLAGYVLQDARGLAGRLLFILTPLALLTAIVMKERTAARATATVEPDGKADAGDGKEGRLAA